MSALPLKSHLFIITGHFSLDVFVVILILSLWNQIFPSFSIELMNLCRKHFPRANFVMLCQFNSFINFWCIVFKKVIYFSCSNFIYTYFYQDIGKYTIVWLLCFTPHEIWQLYIEWIYYSNLVSTVEKW